MIKAFAQRALSLLIAGGNNRRVRHATGDGGSNPRLIPLPLKSLSADRCYEALLRYVIIAIVAIKDVEVTIHQLTCPGGEPLDSYSALWRVTRSQVG